MINQDPSFSKKIIILVNEPIEEMVIGRNGTLTLALSFSKIGYEVLFADEVVIGSNLDTFSAKKISFKSEIFNLYEECARATSNSNISALAYGDPRKVGRRLCDVKIKNYTEVQGALVYAGSDKFQHSAILKLSDQENLWKISELKKIPYKKISIILNRFDPVSDYSRTRDQIDRLKIIKIKTKIRVVGCAENVDKYEPLALTGELSPETLVMSLTSAFQIKQQNLLQAKEMLVRHGSLVVKPAKSGQGKGVKKITKPLEIEKRIREIKDEFGGKIDGGLILQQFVPGSFRGDVRTIFYRNKKGSFDLAGHVARLQAKKGFINCISTGRAVATNPENMLSEKEIFDLNHNSKILLKYLNLHRKNIDSPIVGVDFIPKFLTKKEADESKENTLYIGEINFLCVALFNVIDQLKGISVFAKNSVTSKIVEGILGRDTL